MILLFYSSSKDGEMHNHTVNQKKLIYKHAIYTIPSFYTILLYVLTVLVVFSNQLFLL